MKVLIGFEASGVVRRAFRARGHEAWSCDILPAEDAGSLSCHHYQMDVFKLLAETRGEWDLAIFHPSCTFLSISAEWAYADNPNRRILPGTLIGEDRRRARTRALQTVVDLWTCGIPRICIENPVGVINSRLPFMPKPQYIQPWQFGHDASKKTGLWMKNLPPLEIDPEMQVDPRWVAGPSGRSLPRWGNQTDSGQNKLGPSADRWSQRSRTYEGIADAMALSWGDLEALDA